MTQAVIDAPLSHPHHLYIGGRWVAPAAGGTIDVFDSATEQVAFTVAAAGAEDMDRAIGAARHAFDHGPWPRLSHGERGEFLRAFAEAIRSRADDIGAVWPRESGVLSSYTRPFTESGASEWNYYADLATSFQFEREVQPTSGGAFGLVVKEAVGVVGAIIPWNGPLGSISHKVAPALLAGCTVVLKSAPEAPAIGLIVAEVAEQVGLPPGVLNVVTADREVSERLVRDSRVDKISFTGSTAAGRRIASLLGERIGRYSLELGGKSAAVILDDADLEEAAATIATAGCVLSGQVCYSLTRIVVGRDRHDDLVEALADQFSRVVVGDPYDARTQVGPLASLQQRERVEGYIARGVEEGARLATGGGRPPDLDRGYYVQPTVFANVDNDDVIAREEIFGPVLSVIPAVDEEDALRIANDTIYGLNASVFTPDVERARAVAGRLRTGTVGHNAVRTDLALGFGGFKQSGVGREGGEAGLALYLESKAIILEETPMAYRR